MSQKAQKRGGWTGTCRVCGKTFVATGNSQRCCSKECSREVIRAYNEAYYKKRKLKILKGE